MKHYLKRVLCHIGTAALTALIMTSIYCFVVVWSLLAATVSVFSPDSAEGMFAFLADGLHRSFD